MLIKTRGTVLRYVVVDWRCVPERPPGEEWDGPPPTPPPDCFGCQQTWECTGGAMITIPIYNEDDVIIDYRYYQETICRFVGYT